ncbi:hypothetical protein SUGI_0399300 [Cryptomeria japonica]|uniref:uncharacterized protein LOC131031107 n=1 Tax=Cryptomeria japonica TaxID=3369 RepID=UPI002408C065|nr:uncharacterized protein LOC131031107 [Cryptomeria japonica]GLJ21546.1 hypothetical protein SUGI_0399300 [Cryptomeria japonica]
MEICCWVIPVALLLSLDLVAAHIHGNPADELVDMINKNRSSHIKSPSSQLYDNPGLACMALQYIDTYNGKCDEGKKPPEVDITEVFAPDCGVELATVQTISGRLLACQLHYAEPAQAFSQLLIESKKSLSILYDGNHTEVGVGVSGTNGGGPYFWCALFGSGQTNSTFELEGGKALKQSQGCFSGSDAPCAVSAAALTSATSFFLQFLSSLSLLLVISLSSTR